MAGNVHAAVAIQRIVAVRSGASGHNEAPGRLFPAGCILATLLVIA
jgi:hypothetical protein